MLHDTTSARGVPFRDVHGGVLKPRGARTDEEYRRAKLRHPTGLVDRSGRREPARFSTWPEQAARLVAFAAAVDLWLPGRLRGCQRRGATLCCPNDAACRRWRGRRVSGSPEEFDFGRRIGGADWKVARSFVTSVRVNCRAWISFGPPLGGLIEEPGGATSRTGQLPLGTGTALWLPPKDRVGFPAIRSGSSDTRSAPGVRRTIGCEPTAACESGRARGPGHHAVASR